MPNGRRSGQDRRILLQYVLVRGVDVGGGRDGDTVAIEGFTHLIPFAAGHTRRMPRLTAGPFRYMRYADAYLDPASPLAADAVTASPYLGVGALRPMIDTAVAAGSGVFVLARTSNPEGSALQRAVTASRSTPASLRKLRIAAPS